MQFLPTALRIATPGTWRWLLEFIPSKVIRRCFQIVDAMDEKSKFILAQKKDLLAKGEGAFEHQAGEGKDIMSVLCKFLVKKKQ